MESNNESLDLPSLISNPLLSDEQKEMITIAFNNEIPIDKIILFNKPEFTPKQMDIIIFGFIRKIDASLYCNPLMPEYLMWDIYFLLSMKKDASWLLSSLDTSHMKG